MTDDAGNTETDNRYLAIIRDALRVCLQYQPTFGQRKAGGITLEHFQQIYGDDAFYSWFGLDSPLVYSAHRAAGGMTSVYRQIGIGCQMVFQHILQDTLGLNASDATWSYSIKRRGSKPRTLALDGRIPLASVADKSARNRLIAWLDNAITEVGLRRKNASDLNGCVFEVRQGYKSNDAKRQNADVSNAANAFAHNYLPVMMVMSVQIPASLAERYERAHWLLLRGTTDGDATSSTYAFCQDVLGYDLAGFFRRNSTAIRSETSAVFEGLLQ